MLTRHGVTVCIFGSRAFVCTILPSYLKVDFLVIWYSWVPPFLLTKDHLLSSSPLAFIRLSSTKPPNDHAVVCHYKAIHMLHWWRSVQDRSTDMYTSELQTRAEPKELWAESTAPPSPCKASPKISKSA